MLYCTALRAAIELRCASHRKLAKRLGVSVSTLRNWTAGHRVPRKATHLLLCSVLLVDLPYMLPANNRWLAKRGLK